MSYQIRKLIITLTQVTLLAAVMVGLIFAGIPADPEHYFAGSLLQVSLLENTPGPRIILIGGSNVAFGLDAELMQQTLGIPVINDGLHAGLGVVPLRELKDHIHTGDVIIISLEYNVFSVEGYMNGDPAVLSDWIEYEPRRTRYLSKPWTEAPGIYATMLQRKVNRQINSILFGGSLIKLRTVFLGSNFNANGDFIGHLKMDSLAFKDIPSTPFPVSGTQEEAFLFLENFYQFARKMGAQVYFEAPASRQTNCNITGQEPMLNFFKGFESKSSIPLITRLDQVCMPDKYFFDSAHHLNAQGRKIKTGRLIENLLKMNVVFSHQ